jgi:hypothetical protein
MECDQVESYPDLFVFSASGNELAIRAKAYRANIQVVVFFAHIIILEHAATLTKLVWRKYTHCSMSNILTILFVQLLHHKYT